MPESNLDRASQIIQQAAGVDMDTAWHTATSLAQRDVLDAYHSPDELYDYRMAYNALTFNAWAELGLYSVHKSWRHSDGEECFGGGWFIVCAETPHGLVSNHYSAEYWGLFNIPESHTPTEYDGNTPEVALTRLMLTATNPEGTT